MVKSSTLALIGLGVLGVLFIANRPKTVTKTIVRDEPIPIPVPEPVIIPEFVETPLTLQTALGAAQMASSSDVDPAELRRRVTSPNGTTEQAIKTFMDEGLPATFEKALQACNDRSEELAKELGDA